ncbi:hypothetical protein KC960_00380 [Candidatus Saccharibacteria bacterium]|nr:hypothetical protein [Candidatus Saccharibacteria bacterium]
MINNIEEANIFLSKFVNKTRLITGKDISVNRTLKLLDKVGNPHQKMHVVHIAGTSGKTSTSYYIAELLGRAGLKVGLTVSPHIISVTERLQINGSPLSDKLFCNYLDEFIEEIGEDSDASYYEFLIVMILWVFEKEAVDYAVIETGLGGLHDSTNVCTREDKICVITDIGFDHQKILGNTLSEISTQKAGIIHEKNHVFMHKQSQEIMSQFTTFVKLKNAKLHIVDESLIAKNSQLPNYQKRNWNLAYHVYRYIAERDNLDTPDERVLNETKISVPGRMQIIERGNQTFVLDGAHNLQKMTAFVDSFKSLFGNIKVPIILAVKKDKDYKQILPVLKNIASEVYCFSFNTQQDLYIESVEIKDLMVECKQVGLKSVAVQNARDALNILYNRDENMIVVTGSLYVLKDAINYLNSK